MRILNRKRSDIRKERFQEFLSNLKNEIADPQIPVILKHVEYRETIEPYDIVEARLHMFDVSTGERFRGTVFMHDAFFDAIKNGLANEDVLSDDAVLRANNAVELVSNLLKGNTEENAEFKLENVIFVWDNDSRNLSLKCDVTNVYNDTNSIKNATIHITQDTLETLKKFSNL